MNDYSYRISARPGRLGGGWQLSLFESGKPIDGGTFAVPQIHPAKAAAWWQDLAGSSRLALRALYGADLAACYRAHLELAAYVDGVSAACRWLGDQAASHGYDIVPLPTPDRDGWMLCLYENAIEVAFQLFPVATADAATVSTWWTGLTNAEREHWLALAPGYTSGAAYIACQLAAAYRQADTSGRHWVEPDA